MTGRGRWRALGGGGAVVLLLASTAGVGGAGVCAGVPLALLGAAVGRETEDPRRAAPEGRFLTAADTTLFVQERGPADGPAVLFVHGSASWGGTWVPVMEGLAARGYRCAAVDLPPFGYSDRPADVSRPAQARRLVAAADALGWDRFSLVGHSFGGGATVEAAALAGPRLDRLALVSAALGVEAPPGALGPLAWRPARRVLVSATLTHPALVPAGLRAFAHRDAAVTPEVVARYRRPLAVRGTTDAVADWLPELLAPADSPSRRAETYRALEVRTLLLWGAEDQTTPVGQAEAVRDLLPDARLEVWPGIGHLPQVEAPDEVVAALAGFL